MKTLDTIIGWSKRFMFAEMNYQPLAVLRILISIITLLFIINIGDDFYHLYGYYGLIRGEINNVVVPDFFPTFGKLALMLSEGLGWEEISALRFLRGVLLLGLGFLALGLWTRWTAFVVWFLHLSMINNAIFLSYGYDSFTSNCLLFCLIMPVGHAFSLDNLRKKRPLQVSTLAGLSCRVIQLQACVIYFMSGLNKLSGSQWFDGEAIWRATMQPPLQTYDLSLLAEIPWLPMILGWGVLMLELGYPLLMFHPKTREISFVGVIFMHLGIGLFMNLWFFAMVMITLNVAAFGWEIWARRFPILTLRKRIWEVSET